MRRVDGGDRHALDPHLAAVGLDQPVDEFQRRGLAGAGSAHHRDEAAGLDLQRDVSDREGASAVKDLADLVDLDQRSQPSAYQDYAASGPR